MSSNSARSDPPGQLGAGEFVALLAMLMALQALGVDSMLPALDRIAHDLHVVSANQRQLVIGVFLISAGLTALIPGPLADRYGRRPVVLVALGGYVALSLVCALAPTFPLLLAGRIGMGLFGSALSVLPTAIIRDRFDGDRMARTQSLVGMVFMVVPMVAGLPFVFFFVVATVVAAVKGALFVVGAFCRRMRHFCNFVRHDRFLFSFQWDLHMVLALIYTEARPFIK